VEWICRSRLRGEVHVREDFLGGLLEHVGDLGKPALQGGADLVQLPPGRRPVPLRRRWSGPEPLDHPKNRAAIFGDPGPSPLEGFFQDTLLEGLGRAWGASAEVHPATLLNRPPPRSPRSPARDPSWASEINSRTPRNPRPELVGLAGPYVEPQDFPGPVLTYPNGYHRRSTVPPGRRNAPAPPSRPATHTDTPPPRADSETAPSLQIRETSLRLQPSSPRARTRSSTFRVLTPAQGRLLHHAHQRPLRPPAGLQQAREVAPESARTGPPPPAQTPPAPSAPPPTAAPPPATRPRPCPPGVERNSSNSAILNSGAAGGIHIPPFELVFA
jgi:hypothetical protein